MSVPNVISLTPAGSGWIMVFEDPNGRSYSPVLAWALVREGPASDGEYLNTIHGVDGDQSDVAEAVENRSDFLQYEFCAGCFKSGLCDKHAIRPQPTHDALEEERKARSTHWMDKPHTDQRPQS